MTTNVTISAHVPNGSVNVCLGRSGNEPNECYALADGAELTLTIKSGEELSVQEDDTVLILPKAADGAR